MALIDRSDLKHDYFWSPAPGNRAQQVTDNTIFDRNEGYNVLDFINEYAETRDIRDKEEGLRIESLIQEKLAKEEAKNRQEIMEWLDSLR